MIERKKYISKIDNALNLKKSVFLVWARQVWKTSLMKYIIKNTKKKCFYINFDEIASFWIIEFKNLEDFINYIQWYYSINFEEYDYLFFDEVTRVKNFNIILKWLIDRFNKKRFISSASWNYDIVWDIIEWLAWRVLKIEVFPLDFEEYLLFKWKNVNLSISSENTYNLIENDILEFITYWSYPEVVLNSNYEDKKIILKSIIDSVFEKDLKNFIKANKFINLQKLIIYISNNIGSLFSYEGISNELWIKLNDIKHLITLLEKSYLIFTISPFYKDKKKEYSKKQKIYFNNFWFINYFLNNLEIKKNISWKDIEQMIYLNLRFNLWISESLYFYQKLNWSEIDFIYEKSWKLIPIESKSNNKDNIPRIFNSFEKQYKDNTQYFIKSIKYKTFERKIDNKKVIIKPFYTISWL